MGLLRRQTAKARPPRLSATTGRSVSTATPRESGAGRWGLVLPDKRSPENQCVWRLGSAALPPLQVWNLLEESVVFFFFFIELIGVTLINRF